jgi:hypothetical protein
MTGISRALAASLMLGCMAGAQQADAYTLSRCSDGAKTITASEAAKWPTGTLTTFYARNSDFARGPEESATRLPNTYKSVLEWAVAEYELAPHNLNSFIRYDSSLTPTLGNNRNEITFDNAACSIGCAYVLASCSSGIYEADIQLKKITWTTSTSKAKHFPYAADKFFDFRAVALHELGHAFGLEHTANVYNLMGDQNTHSHTNGNISVPYIGGDDAKGLVALYGTRSGGRPELSVSHWRFTSPDGANVYSLHRFASILDSAGAKIAPTGNIPNSSERLYTLRRGQVVMPEFTLESTGTALGSFETRYYLSTDDTIASSDRLLATFGGQTLATGAVKLYRHSVTIPTNAATNTTLYLGIIVDTLNQNAESHDDAFGNSAPPAYTGNATYIPITVVP